MDRGELVAFVGSQGLAVVATNGPDGVPEAALVGVAATEELEIVFDTSRRSRKLTNIERDPAVALVVGGWQEELTLQVEGTADVLTGGDRERCLAVYVDQYPDGLERAASDDIVLVRVRPRWARLADYRADSFGSTEETFS